MCIIIYALLHWCLNPLLLDLISSANQTDSINHTFAKRSLPYIGRYPINTDDMDHYLCLYFMQIVGGISSVFGIICYGAFYITMLIVICAQFRYINATLARIDSDK